MSLNDTTSEYTVKITDDDPVIEEKDIENALLVANKKMKNKSDVRNIANNVINDPSQIAEAQRAAINNPHLMRAAQRLNKENSQTANSISGKQRKKLMKMQGKSKASLPSEDRLTQKKVVMISRATGKRVMRLFPDTSTFTEIEVLEIFKDVFIIHDLALKKKNKYATLLTEHADVTIYGDAYIYQCCNKQTIDTDIELVNQLFNSLPKK